MLAIFKKELTSFFATPVGYLVMGIFWILSGLFIWVFKGTFNILEYGFAELGPFFLLAPWIFMFLIPGLAMRTFSEERKLGTLELLLSRPLSLKEIILGKFTGVFVLGIMSLLPSLIYTYTIYNLSPQSGSPDLGLIIGGFIGLLLLLALFTAIGLFTSSLTDNQIAAFLSAAVLLFILYFGFENLAGLLERAGLILSITAFGIKFHYENIGQGLIDSRDIAYFFSLTLVFLFWTGVRLNKLRA